MSLYKELLDSGIDCSSWQSDLYFPATPEALEILRRYQKESAIASRFKSKIDGNIMIEVPFAYTPFWERLTP